jgi:hypothetical protein
LEQIDYANGNSAIYTYDNFNRLKKLEHSDATRVIAGYDYTLAADGMRTASTEQLWNNGVSGISHLNRRLKVRIGFTPFSRPSP